MTEAAGEDIGLASGGDDLRQRRVIAGVPHRGDEAVTKLAPGIARGAIRHAYELAVIHWRLVIGIVRRIRPPWRIGRRGRGWQRRANDGPRQHSCSFSHDVPPKCGLLREGARQTDYTRAASGHDSPLWLISSASHSITLRRVRRREH